MSLPFALASAFAPQLVGRHRHEASETGSAPSSSPRITECHLEERGSLPRGESEDIGSSGRGISRVPIWYSGAQPLLLREGVSGSMEVASTLGGLTVSGHILCWLCWMPVSTESVKEEET